MNWLHHLLNPHCPQCVEEREKKENCKSCETLETQLSHLRYENERLLSAILNKDIPQPQAAPPADFKPILPRNVPWSVKRQILENEERHAAKLRKEAEPIQFGDVKEQTIEELEKKMGIANVSD